MYVRNILLGFAAAVAALTLVQEGRTAQTEMRPEPAVEDRGIDTYRDTCRADEYCDDACGDACGVSTCCCNACCVPCWQFYGDFLYLRPRNANIEYAVPMDGSISPGQVPIQVGRIAAVNPQFEPGFRVGLARAFDECSSLGAAYTHYENRTDDSISVDAPYVIRSMVMHPSTSDAAADWLDAAARMDIDFDIADAEYRRVFLCDDRYSLSYLLGARYVSLEQRFSSQFASTITEYVNSDVNFDGAGIRLGLEGERFAPGRQLFLYGKASASFLGGEFRGTYFQGSTADPVIVDTSWREARVVSILDCELGVGWASCNDCVRISAGYMFSSWMNVVKPSEFISSVQANQYHGPDKISGNGLEFDGLVARIELRR